MWKSRCQTYLLENHIDALKAKKMHTHTHRYIYYKIDILL